MILPPMSSPEFVDQIRVRVTGGRGGNGCSSTHREKYIPLGGPDGGNGGRGGSVIFVASRNVASLFPFGRKRHWKADSGTNGSSNDCFGRMGADIKLEVPVGTMVKSEDGELLADMVEVGQEFLAAAGGRGGRGNHSLACPANPYPTFAEKGEPGEERWLQLELKLIADIALVGFPNVGKSTLISRLSRAKPKIAPYPFTTLAPNLGVMELGAEGSVVIADIPGLIEGAHEGKGLGHTFLRHIERTRLVVHLIDVSAWEGRDPVDDYKKIRKELERYSKLLGRKPEVIVGNKLDVPGSEDTMAKLAKKLKKKVFGISAVTGQGLDQLKHHLAEIVRDLPAPEAPAVLVRTFRGESEFTVTRVEPHLFEVKGAKVEKKVEMTPLDNEQAVHFMQRAFEAMGVEEELRRAGIQSGDEVRIGTYVFTYDEEED